jgi:hypothetical protein
VQAFDQPTAAGAAVRLIENSYMPDSVYFQVSMPVANCPAFSWLTWEGGNSFPRGSNENGQFFGNVQNTANAEATINVTWNALLASLSAGNVEQAVQYFAHTSRDRYRAIFTRIGEAVKQIPPGLSNFAAMRIDQNMAEFVVDQTVQGQTTMNFVIFVYQENRWQLWEF